MDTQMTKSRQQEADGSRSSKQVTLPCPGPARASFRTWNRKLWSWLGPQRKGTAAPWQEDTAMLAQPLPKGALLSDCTLRNGTPRLLEVVAHSVQLDTELGDSYAPSPRLLQEDHCARF